MAEIAASPVREFTPGAGLETMVDAFWIRAAATPLIGRAEPELPVRVFADGCIDLIWRFQRDRSGESRGPQLYLAGPRARWYPAAGDRETEFVGVRLRPGMSRLLLDVDPTAILGIDPPATALDPTLADLADQLAATVSSERMLAVLHHEVLRRITTASGRHLPPRRVRHALTLLRHGDPAASIAGIAAMLEVSPRSLHRDIVEWTGLPPKTLARIRRFQAVLGRLRCRPGTSLGRLAHEGGYADHAHMTREFKELAGVPPSAAPLD